jgi:DNA-directed RNA polymerase subunit P
MSNPETKEVRPAPFGSIIYECERCGTKQSLEELLQFPELRCKNCGFRALKKVGPVAPKRIGAI